MKGEIEMKYRINVYVKEYKGNTARSKLLGNSSKELFATEWKMSLLINQLVN